MRKKYIILVEGCDDDTIIEKDLTLAEFKLIQSVSNEITEASQYQCMPRMYIKEKERWLTYFVVMEAVGITKNFL